MKDTLHSIRRNSHRFFSGTLLSRFSGMLRDMSMAYIFGTQSSIAAFMVAFRLAHLLRRLFGEGALQSAFIPEFEALRHQDEPRAFTLFRDLNIALMGFLIFAIIIVSGILGGFLYAGNLTSANQEIVYLTLLMLPSLLFICLFGLNTSFLQCEKSYFIPSVAPVAFNGIWIISIFSLRKMPAEQAMPWLACGVVIACFCQWFLTVPLTWKILKRILSASFWHSFSYTSSDLLKLCKPLLLGIIGVGASQINNAMDSLFARFADPEGPAILWYAIRIQQLPLALFGIAIAGAVLPPLVRAFKAQRQEEYHHFLHDALYRTWTFMLPLTAALFIMGDTTVNFLYGRGDFNPHSVIKTTYCLWAYGIGLVPSALILILAPASYAKNNYLLPALASLTAMLLNLSLNYFFITYLEWGAMSIALATSVSAWINFFWLGAVLSRTGTVVFSWALLKRSLSVNLSTVVALGGTYLIRIVFQHLPFFSERLFSSSFIQQCFIFIFQIFTFGMLFSSTFYCSYLFSSLLSCSFFSFRKSKNNTLKIKSNIDS